MRSISCRDWQDFHRKFLFRYASEGVERHSQLLFRGHSVADWGLQTTLDRHRRFPDDVSREHYYDKFLLPEFRREAIVLHPTTDALPHGIGFELLARHHRLPSPFLDWTESPYIAAYFAFEGAVSEAGNQIAIWVLDCGRFHFEGSGIDRVNDREDLRFNPRALRQRGQFTRIRTIARPLEEILGGALTRIKIPSTSRSIALTSLVAMTINAARLYGDLDGVAKTITERLNISDRGETP